MTDSPVIDAREDDVTLVLEQHPPSSDREAQYREWAERLRAKREAARQRIRGTEPKEPTPSYWRTEDVFREGERLAGEELTRRPNAAAVGEMLSVLGLDASASPRDIELAYRRLAKAHHPDRHVDDDEPERAYHAEQMRRINETYARLRQLESA